MVQPDAPEKEDRKRLPLGSGTAKAGGVESASLFKEEFGCTTMGWKVHKQTQDYRGGV